MPPSSAALLLFDPNNLRYVTSTAIGTWERDKNIRFALVSRERRPDPVGLRLRREAPQALLPVAARGELARVGAADARRDAGRDGHSRRARRDDLRASSPSAGSRSEPVGMDVPDITTLLALQRKGIEVADSQPIMLEARKLKTEDEIALLDHAAGDRRRGLRGDLPACCAPGSRRTRSSPPR